MKKFIFDLFLFLPFILLAVHQLSYAQPRYPETCNYVGTEKNPLFCFYDHDTESPLNLTLNNINPGKFARKNTTIIIHGFNSNLTDPWVTELRKELFQLNDPAEVNVLVVDWSRQNELKLTNIRSMMGYFDARYNMEKIAEELAELIDEICRLSGTNYSRFSIIGHSLGSHLAGTVGVKLKKFNPSSKLAWIIGADPAGPTYERIDGDPFSGFYNGTLRLSDEHATYVLVIHSDGTLGINRKIGHLDVYVNGGDNQPGCFDQGSKFADAVAIITNEMRTGNNNKRGLIPEGLFGKVFCDHTRAPYFVIDLIKFIIKNKKFNDKHNSDSPIYPLARECNSLDDYRRGKCSECGGTKCNEVGNFDRTPAGPTKTILLANDQRPFIGHQIVLDIDRYREYSMKKVEMEFFDILSAPGKRINVTQSYNTTFMELRELGLYKVTAVVEDIPSVITIRNPGSEDIYANIGSLITLFDYNHNSMHKMKYEYCLPECVNTDGVDRSLKELNYVHCRSMYRSKPTLSPKDLCRVW